MFEDKPSLDARDLFSNLDPLKTLLEKRTHDFEERKKKDDAETETKKDGEATAETDVKADSEPAETAPPVTPVVTLAVSESPASDEAEETSSPLVLVEVPENADELASAIEHLSILLKFIEELFASTLVLPPRLLPPSCSR